MPESRSATVLAARRALIADRYASTAFRGRRAVLADRTRGVVVARRSSAATSVATGNETVNVDPRCRRDCTVSVPPWACAIHWLIASPSPNPPRSESRERARSARQNRSKMYGRSRGRNADSRVAHGELHFPVASLQRELHRAAPRRVLDRVRDEVEEQLPQTQPVAET